MSGGPTFAGYRREDGHYGVRNHVLVLGLNGPVMAAAKRIADAVTGTVLFASPYGRAGNSYCSAVAPTIKISARPDTVTRLPTQIDFDAGAVFVGREDIDAAADRLFALLLDVCSGLRTWGEILNERAESVIRVGGSL